MKFIKKLIKKLQKKRQPDHFTPYYNKLNKYHLFSNFKFIKDVKLKIITSFDENYNEIGKFTTATMSNYAKKYNFEFESIPMDVTGRPQSWNKINLIQNEIKKNKNDYIMWIDADAFFSNEAENIASVLNEKFEIYLSSHYCGVFKGSIYKNTILTTQRINCGVMIFKTSDFSSSFLQKVWDYEKYINHTWYEQAAIMDLVGLKADISGNLNDNIGNNYYLKKIKFLNKEWNSIPSFSEISTESIRPSIIHLAGMSNVDRLGFLTDYAKRGKIL